MSLHSILPPPPVSHLDDVALLLPVEVDLEGEDDHGDAEPDQGGDEDASERGQRDALGVVQGGAEAAQGAVPVLGAQRLEVAVLLKLKNHLQAGKKGVGSQCSIRVGWVLGCSEDFLKKG